jgi:hypothetical protein
MPKDNTTATMQTMTTTMSTLTQNSINDAVANLRKETEQSINSLRDELKMEMKSMETSIATAVVAALRNNPNNMELEQSEAASVDSNQTGRKSPRYRDNSRRKCE